MPRVFIFLLAALTLATSPARADTLISNHCLGNAFETCFLLIEGPIETGLTARVQATIEEGVDGRRIMLNSPGGNLGEALKLGRYLRANDYDTTIGSSDGMERDAAGNLTPMTRSLPGAGRCESACAYVFMGGTRRRYDEDDRLGLHRFHAPGQQIGSDAAQQLSGQLISYMVEMGIDARIFTLASGQSADEMYHVPLREAELYDLTTPFGYDAVFLEPYKEGIVASAKRLDAVSAYSGVDQVTFFCRGGTPFLLMHAALHGLQPDAAASFESRFDDTRLSLPGSHISTRIAGDEAFLTVRLTPQIVTALTTADNVWVAAAYARVYGGNYAASMSPSTMDRQKIAAAYRFCIG